jgi:hypothetical protein
MEFTKKVKQIVCSALLAGALLFPIKSFAKTTGSIDAIASEAKGASYLRLNGSYSLPGKVSGYTFLELYGGDKGYFGKTSLTKNIAGPLSATSEITHVNAPISQIGVGAKVAVPMPQKAYCTVKLLPCWVDNTGKHVDNKVIAGYAIGTSLGKGWSIGSFGEMNIGAKGGPQWGYGEVSVTKSVTKDLSVSYNPALKFSGTAAPKLEHRISMTLML